MHYTARHRRPARLWVLSSVSGALAAVVMGAVVALTGVMLPLPAQQAHAESSSAVTVKATDQDRDIANAPLPDLAVTVSQTRDLLAQGIEVSWTGGKKSGIPTGATGGSDFLQITQCWGDDPDNPDQPDRTTCQYGGFGTAGAYRYSTTTDYSTVAEQDKQYTVPSTSPFSPTFTGFPFKSATGETIFSVKDHKMVPGVDPSTNQFFTRLTTNEVPWAGSASNGEGSAKFEVQTATQAPGLGCGAPVTTGMGSAAVTTGASCWLVIIPRGTADVGQPYVVNSGLSWDAWKHRIAIRLKFQPVGVRCTIGAAERQLAGSELIADAVRSWQPQLCGTKGGAAYTLIGQSESDAALAANQATVQPLALTSRPLTADLTDSLTYAPVALTGLAISFAIDRAPSASGTVPPEALDRERLPFTSLNLTPRLVAKLLTYSYVDSLPNGADKSELGFTSLKDPGSNARNLTDDPDFLAVNDPEWAHQAITSPSVADLITPLGRSDGAWALWNYVLSDPEGADFLAGKPDPWNMTVNPYSSTDATKNRNGVALALPRDDFPKTSPIERAAVPPPSGAGAVNLVTWRPYSNDFDTSASLTLRGDGQVLGGWDILANPPKYGKAPRNVPGLQSVIGLTDFAAAAKYQVYTAALRNPAGKFVAPSADSLSAAAAAMTPAANQPQVSAFDPASAAAQSAPDAYPLALPVYAAVNPAMEDPAGAKGALRADYAAFIRYAATSGQAPGTGIGQLPPGYAPIPQPWRDQALAAASTIEKGPQPVAPAVTPPAAARPAAAAAAVAPPAVQPAQTPPDPSASGPAAGALNGAATPADPAIGAITAAVPSSIFAGLGAAVCVPLLSRIRRRL